MGVARPWATTSPSSIARAINTHISASGVYSGAISQLDEVGLRGPVQQLLAHGGFGAQVAGDVQDLVADIAGVRGAQLAIAFDVPLLQQIGQPPGRTGNPPALRPLLDDTLIR